MSFLILFLIVLANTLLLFTFRNPGLSYFDGSEYALHIAQGGLAHAPGYPLYLWIGRFLKQFIMDDFLILHLINQISLLVCVGFMVLTLKRVSDSNKFRIPWTIVLTIFIFISSFYVRLYTVLPEVLIPNLALFSLCIWVVQEAYLKNFKATWVAAIFGVFGLGLAHHHSLALLLPGVLYLIWIKNISFKKWIPPALIGFAVGALPLLYMFHAVNEQTEHTYFFVNDLRDFFFVLFRRAYGTFQLSRANPNDFDFSSSITGLKEIGWIFFGFFKSLNFLNLFFLTPLIWIILRKLHSQPQRWWVSLKEQLRSPVVTLTSSAFFLYVFLFGLRSYLDLDSIVNQETFLRFVTLPTLLASYWIFYSLEVLRNNSKWSFHPKFKCVIAGFFVAVLLAQWPSSESLDFRGANPMKLHFDEAYKNISESSNPSCAIFITSDSLTYSLLYENSVTRKSQRNCYVFTTAQFSGHFRAKKEELLLHSIFGDNYEQKFAAQGLTEIQLSQILADQLLKKGFEIYLLHPRDIQIFRGAGYGIQLRGNVLQLIRNNEGSMSAGLRQKEWQKYLSWLENLPQVKAAHLQLDEYAAWAWLQNIFIYEKSEELLNKEGSGDFQSLRMQNLKVKSDIARKYPASQNVKNSAPPSFW